jgi:phage terminase small subunit
MKEWWAAVLEAYDLDRHHLHLLEAASGSWDRMKEARAAIDEHGLTYTDQNGCPKPRPEVTIEKDSRIAFARLIRELDLDEAPPPEPRGRPPGIRSNRR